METVTVKILEGGKTCREVNAFPDMSHHRNSFFIVSREALEKYKEWEEAESKLRTWEIENIASTIPKTMYDNIYIFIKTKYGNERRYHSDTHQAQIINGKAVIV